MRLHNLDFSFKGTWTLYVSLMLVSPLVRFTSLQLMHMVSQGHTWCRVRASMGNFLLVTKLCSSPVMEQNLLGSIFRSCL